MDILAGVRVVDSSTGIAGPYATKLFADAGAEVVRTGAAVSGTAASSTALSRYLAAGKATAANAAGEDHLLAGADLVVLSDGLSPDTVSGLRRRHPHLVVVT